MDKRRAHIAIVVHGRVQGVCYRAFTQSTAERLGITGFARNVPRGTVEIQAEGRVGTLEEFITHLKGGPPGAQVQKIDVNWSENLEYFTTFSIRY